MHLHLILLSLCACFLAAGDADGIAAQEKKADRTASSVNRVGKATGSGKAFRLFILSGQSNMAAMSEREFIIPHLLAAFPDDELLLVKDSLSGQPIRRWYKDWKPAEGWKPKNNRDKPGNNDLYQKLMGMVKESVGDRKPDTISFMWMQGEADAKAGQSDQYEESLRGLIKQLRDDLGRQDVTAVIGRISDCNNGDPGWDMVRKGQVAAVAGDPLAAWFDTDDLNGDSNALHYMAGYKGLGERFCAKTVDLLKKQKP
jgi:hypothetical protein